jgi:hypothetical protein
LKLNVVKGDAEMLNNALPGLSFVVDERFDNLDSFSGTQFRLFVDLRSCLI